MPKRTVEFAHDVGDEVIVGDTESHARVDSLCMDAMGVQYRIVYWNGGDRKSAWVYDWELRSNGRKRIGLGQRQSDNKKQRTEEKDG